MYIYLNLNILKYMRAYFEMSPCLKGRRTIQNLHIIRRYPTIYAWPLSNATEPRDCNNHNSLILDVAFKRATLILIHVAAAPTSLLHLFKSPLNGRPVYFNNKRAERQGDRTVSHDNIFLLCHRTIQIKDWEDTSMIEDCLRQ